MDDGERLELLLSVIEDLSSVFSTHIILVEGVNDVSSLREAGVTGSFFCVQSGGGPVRAAEHVWKEGKCAVILTDWDRRGGNLAKTLEENLSSLGVRYDSDIRRRMSVACKPFCKDVESVHSVIRLLFSRVAEGHH